MIARRDHALTFMIAKRDAEEAEALSKVQPHNVRKHERSCQGVAQLTLMRPPLFCSHLYIDGQCDAFVDKHQRNRGAF